MQINEDDRYNLGQSDDDILFEVSNFNSRVTGLPTNIEIWLRSDPVSYGHNRYRIKILKDKEWAGIYTIGKFPDLIKNINQTITQSENKMIIDFISNYLSLLIGLIDGEIDSGEFALEILKLRGSI